MDFLNDDEYGLHLDYERWPLHEPVSGCPHNQTGEVNASVPLKRQVAATGTTG